MTKAVFSRRELSLLAQVPDPVLSFWLEKGVIQPTEQPRGKGHDRTFNRAEVAIASILMLGRGAGLNIGALGRLAEQARKACLLRESVELPSRWFGEMTGLVVDGARDFGILIDRGHMTLAEKNAVLAAANKFTKGHYEDLWLGNTILYEPGLLVAFQAGTNAWRLETYAGIEGKLEREENLRSDFYLILNFPRAYPNFSAVDGE